MKQSAFFLLLILVVGCKKPENRTCWKFEGPETTRVVSLPTFDKLFLTKHLRYSIIQDSTNCLVINGGENVVNLVTYSVDQYGLLTIENTNRCGFLRDEKKVIHVEIHCTSISNIHFEGGEPLETLGTLNSDYFVLFIRDGAGPVRMKLKSKIVFADISNGWGDYTLSGSTEIANIGAKSNGYCDVTGLQISDSIYVASETQGDILLNCNGIPLTGYIKSGGSVRYRGIPTVISVIDTGIGELIDEN
jgi:hypothetical protein